MKIIEYTCRCEGAGNWIQVECQLSYMTIKGLEFKYQLFPSSIIASKIIKSWKSSVSSWVSSSHQYVDHTLSDVYSSGMWEMILSYPPLGRNLLFFQFNYTRLQSPCARSLASSIDENWKETVLFHRILFVVIGTVPMKNTQLPTQLFSRCDAYL